MVLIFKGKIAALAAAALLLSASPAGAAGADYPGTSADCAVVMHSGGRCVYEKNADRRALIASTTKLMTALVTLENAELEESVEIKREYCEPEGSSMYLRPGETRTVRELLLGLLLVSGNDAALALAGHVSGGEEEFVALMNRRARELRMTGTSFANPHGLDAKGHYSTARDMATLMLACMEDARFRELCGTKSCRLGEDTLQNHNRLLWSCPGCTAGKTGYTMAAGRCLVSCCEREGTLFVCVTLSDPDDWNDHQRLYDWAFSRYSVRELCRGLSFDVPVVSGSAATVSVVPAEELRELLPKSAEISVVAEMPKFIFAPVKMGETAGQIWFIMKGEKIAGCRLVYAGDVALAQRCGYFGAVWEKL